VTFAGLNYEVWWAYEGEHSRPDVVDALNAHPVFFQTSIHAHFLSLVVLLYRLYETRKDTYNIPQLLKLAREGKHLDGIAVKGAGATHRVRVIASFIAAKTQPADAQK
jgi:hypothetical protein